MKRILFTVLIALLVSIGLQAQITWTGLNGPYGGRVNDIIQHSSGAMIIGTETAGVLRSTDGGITWTKITTGSVVRISDVDLDVSGNVYAVSNSSSLIYKSTDGGVNFSPITSNNVFSLSKIEAVSATEIYIASGTTVYKSIDSGATFNIFSNVSFTVADLDFVSGSPTYLYISTLGGGVRVSTNSAAPSSSGTGLTGPGLTVYSLCVNSSGIAFALGGDGPYTSTNQGSTWTSIIGTIPAGSFSGVIGLDVSNNLYLVDGTSYIAYSSLNSGVTWSAGASFPKTSIKAALFLSTTNWLLATDPNGILVTGNAGTAWTPSSSGFKALIPSHLFALSNFPTTLYMIAQSTTTSTGPGYYQSNDDGATWNLNLNGVSGNGPVYSFASPANPVILAATSTGVMRSIDQGANWATVSANVYSQASLVAGTNVTYTISGSSLETSIDQGVNWTSLALTGFSGTATGALYLDAGGSLYCRTTGNALYKINTTTGAATLLSVTGIDFSVAGNSVYALTNSTTLNVSTDNGVNWLASGLGSFSATRIWALPNNVILTRGTTNTVNYSVDNGSTWTANPLNETSAVANSIMASTAGIAYVATANSVVHKSPATLVPPAAPSTLTIIGSQSTFVDLHWIDNANNESSFVVQRSVGSNTSYADYTTAGISSSGRIHVLTAGLSPATLYYFRVAAVNAAGRSAYSSEISFTTPPTCATPNVIPNNRSWAATAAAEPGYTGNPPGSPWVNTAVQITTSGTQYSVSRYSNNIVPPTVHPEPPNNTFREECGATYFNDFIYDAANGNGTWDPNTNTLVLRWQSRPSYINQFKGTTTYVLNPSDPIPATPTLNLNIFSSTSVFLYWSLVAFETQYKVYRSTTSGSGFVEVATVTYPTTFYVDKNLTTGTTYYYRVTALNATGESAQSPQIAVTPTTTTLFTPTENDISLNYDSQQGSSWGDFDNDGDEDIATPAFIDRFGNTVPPNFYENLGANQFTKRNIAALVDENTAVSRGMAVFDFNNDGKLDVYVGRSGSGIHDLLLTNNGGWDFSKTAVTESIVPLGPAFRGVAILDYDKDGYADVYAGNDNAGLDPPTFTNVLLKTNANATFTAISTGPHVTESNNSRTASAADYDNDGDQDLFVLNWSNSGLLPNKLYKNNGDGTFARVSGTIFDTDLFALARTISWADIDNDGDLDLYVGSLGGTVSDRLYQNNGDGTFTSLSSSAVAENATGTFGSTFGDINNDGAIDLISINAGANSIFLNTPATPGVFTKYSGVELLTSPQISEIGGSMGDYDKDGFLDIYPGNSGGNLPNLLYRNNLTPSASRNWIQVKLEGVLSNRAALGTRVKVITTQPARTQIREVAGLTGYGGQNSLIQHFGLGTATTISQLQITWPSGKVMNLTNIASNQILNIKEDGDGPTITLSPAHGLTNVVPTNTISITVADATLPLTRVAGKKLTIIKTATPGTPVKVWDIVTDATVSGSTYTFTLPATMDFSTEYSISIDAGAVRDFYENTSLAVPNASWTFTTQAQPDLTPPVFAAFTPQPLIPFGTAPAQQFSITATDNNAVTAVKMFYRKISQTSFASTLCTAAASNAYTIGLQSTYVDDMGIQFYFKAYDAAGNFSRSPIDSTYYVSRIVFNNQNIGIPVTSGGEVNDYQIVSVPFELESQQVQFIFEELGSPDKTKWRLLKYQHSPQAWIDYPSGSFSNINQGEGYFVNSRAGQNIAFGNADSPSDDDVKSPNNHQGSLFQLNLKQGWNLIGNPYALKIFWDQSKPAGVGPLKIYSGGTYANAPNGGELDRLKGGFVLADNDVVVPVNFNVTASGGRVGSDPLGSSDLTLPAWAIQLNLEQQKSVYTLGGIGMHPDALSTKDDFDDVNPPRLLDQLEINFAHPEYFLKQFSRDVVPTQGEYQWEFVVNSNLAGIANLFWDNSKFGANQKDLYLFDMSRQRLTDMRELSSYSFDPTLSHTFTIYFGENLKDKIKPSMMSLGDAYPNPASTATIIPFTLPENGGHHDVRLEVYDMTGQHVATLVDGQFKAGFYAVEWDVNRSSIINGLYLYRMKVSGAEVVTKKIVVNK